MDVAEGGGTQLDLFQRRQIAELQLRTVVEAIGLLPDLSEANEPQSFVVGDLADVEVEEAEAADEQLVQSRTVRHAEGVSVSLRLLDIRENLVVVGDLRHGGDTREALVADDDALQTGEIAQVEADDELETVVADEDAVQLREVAQYEGGEQRVAAAAVRHRDVFHVRRDVVQVGARADDVAGGGAGDGDGDGDVVVGHLHAAERPVGEKLQRAGEQRRAGVVEPGVIVHGEVAEVPLALVENAAVGVVDAVAVGEVVLPAAVVETLVVLEAEAVAAALVVDELATVDQGCSIGSKLLPLTAARVVAIDTVFKSAFVAAAAVLVELRHDATIELAVHCATLVVHVVINGENAIVTKLIAESILGCHLLIVLSYRNCVVVSNGSLFIEARHELKWNQIRHFHSGLECSRKYNIPTVVKLPSNSMLNSSIHGAAKGYSVVFIVQNARACNLVITKGELGTDHILVGVQIRVSLSLSISPHCLEIVAIVRPRIVDSSLSIQGNGRILHLNRADCHVREKSFLLLPQQAVDVAHGVFYDSSILRRKRRVW